MPPARFYFRFQVSSLLVDNEVADVPLSGVVDGRRMAIRIPPDPRVFDRSITDLPVDPGLDPTGSPNAQPRSVGAIQVEVDAWLGTNAAELDLLSDYRPVAEISDEMDAALGIARGVLGGLIDWSRVALQQYGLGLEGEQPSLHEWQRILDVEAGRFYNIALAAPAWASFTPAAAVPVSRDFLERILEGGHAEPAPAAYLLLADARHLAWRGDWSRAVVLAAMGVEMRVKEQIRALTEARIPGGESRQTGRRRARAVVDLFNQPMLALAGRSLRRDDTQMFKGLAALFEARNALLHDGIRPTEAAGRSAIGSAIGGFRWLESLDVTQDAGTAPAAPATVRDPGSAHAVEPES